MTDSRVKVYRVDQQQSNSFKREMAFAIFVIISLFLICCMFLNPAFMKGQIRSSNNRAVVTRQINGHFDTLARYVGDDQGQSSNLLTDRETLPIADRIIDYSLGIHWPRLSSLELGQQILHDINLNIDTDSSSEAQQINHDLKKQKANAVYIVNTAFNLSVVSLGANIVLVLWAVNLIIIILTVISMLALIQEMKVRLAGRTLIHDVAAGTMWAGFWLMLIYGLFSLVPVFFNVENLVWGELAYLIELSSSVFLEFVIAGAIIFVLAAIPWQITATE